MDKINLNYKRNWTRIEKTLDEFILFKKYVLNICKTIFLKVFIVNNTIYCVVRLDKYLYIDYDSVNKKNASSEMVENYLRKSISMKDMVDRIDLTKTQRERAETLYENLCNALRNEDIKVRFYAQGSFASRTVIRPFKDGVDKAFDIDVIYEIQDDKNKFKPGELKDLIKEAIKTTQYWEKTTVHDKCFTVEYAEQDGVAFSIDLVPAIPEDLQSKSKLNLITEQSHLIDTAIAIPSVSNSTSEWVTNNPKGYLKWFERELSIFNENYIEAYRKREVYANIEDLPKDDGANNLRTVIKFLKRNRDVFFAEIESDNKPASIIITTIVAKMAQFLIPTVSSLDLLSQVLDQLRYLAPNTDTNIYSPSFDPFIKNIIRRDNNDWQLYNPANGKDNLLDGWNDNVKLQKDFFEWVSHLTQSYKNLSSKDNEKEIVNEYSNMLNIPNLLAEKSEFKVTKQSPKPYRNEVRED